MPIFNLKSSSIQGINLEKHPFFINHLPKKMEGNTNIEIDVKISEFPLNDDDEGMAIVDYRFNLNITSKEVTTDEQQILQLQVTVRLIFSFPFDKFDEIKGDKSIHRVFFHTQGIDLAWPYWRQNYLQILALAGMPRSDLPALFSSEEE